MADNYLEFSEIITELTPDEVTWIKAALDFIYVADGVVYREDAAPGTDADEHDYHGPACFWDGNQELVDCPEHLGFSYAFEDDETLLWIYGDGGGDPHHVAVFVQQFLRKFRPRAYFSLTWAAWCSKPRIGEFCGGAFFVTADDIAWQNSHNWLDEQFDTFQNKTATSRRDKHDSNNNS